MRISAPILYRVLNGRPSASPGNRTIARAAAENVQRPLTTLESAWGLDAPPIAAYVHLPFCKRKCFYCDFPVVAVGTDLGRPVVQDKFASYVDALCEEMDGHQRLNDAPLQTLFFGGGTPSLIPPELLTVIISKVKQRFGLCDSAEISMEADPGTFDRQRLEAYMAAGITRFSVGVQAFDEELLAACGRAHTLADVYSAIEALHAAAPPSWSLDIISGLPGLTEQQWQHNLHEAIKAQPDHISVYDLQVEEGTPFDKWVDSGKLQMPEEDSAARMFELASETLRGAGFEHYELSNYARSGHRCRHNQVYWRGHAYYAFGVGAASYLRGRRFSRPATMNGWKAYVAGMADAVRGSDMLYVAGADAEEQSQQDAMLECVMLQLRLADGVDLGWFRDTFGGGALERLLAGVAPHVAQGRAVICAQGEDRAQAAGVGAGAVHYTGSSLRLTDPAGLIVSNSVISDVFVALDDS